MSDLEDDVPLKVRDFDEYQLAQIGRMATSFVKNRKPDEGVDMTRYEDVDDLRDVVRDDDLIRDVVGHAMILAIQMHEFMMSEAGRVRRAKRKQERALKKLERIEQHAVAKKVSAVNKLKPGLIRGPVKTEPISEKVAAEFNQLFTTLAAMAKPRSTTNESPD